MPVYVLSSAALGVLTVRGEFTAASSGATHSGAAVWTFASALGETIAW